MCKFLLLGSILILCGNLPIGNCKKDWGSKNMRKLSKPEVDVKTYVFPCAMNPEEVKFLNNTQKSKENHFKNCKRKLVIKMTVNSGGEFSSKTDGFIPIDHVIDGISGRKKRLLNPLMIRIKREKMYQLYDLQLIKAVNGEAKEDVINYENTSNFTGCDTASSHPTCGFSYFNNKLIQYSEGFCCSCDQAINDQREPCEGRSGQSKLRSQAAQCSLNRQHRSDRTSRELDLSDSRLDRVILASADKEEMNNRQNEKTFLQKPSEGVQLLQELNSENVSLNDNSDFDPDYSNSLPAVEEVPIVKETGEMFPFSIKENENTVVKNDVQKVNIPDKSDQNSDSEYVKNSPPGKQRTDSKGKEKRISSVERIVNTNVVEKTLPEEPIKSNPGHDFGFEKHSPNLEERPNGKESEEFPLFDTVEGKESMGFDKRMTKKNIVQYYKNDMDENSQKYIEKGSPPVNNKLNVKNNEISSLFDPAKTKNDSSSDLKKENNFLEMHGESVSESHNVVTSKIQYSNTLNKNLTNQNCDSGNNDDAADDDDSNDDVDCQSCDITVKSYQFEHSFVPEESSFTVSSIEFAVEGQDNNNKGKTNNYSIISNVSEGLSQEKLRMLLMNKIKINKKAEQVLNNSDDSCLLPEQTKSPNSIRSLTSDSNKKLCDEKINTIKRNQTKFFLRLESGNSQLDIQIVPKNTEKPQLNEQNNSINDNKYNLEPNLNRFQNFERDNSSNCTNSQSTAQINDLQQLFETSTFLVLSDATIKALDEDGTKQQNTTHSLNAMENIIYKLVPLINSAHTSVEDGETDKTKALFRDPKNQTHNVCMNVTMKETPPGVDHSVNINLSSEKVSNKSLLPDYSVLKPRSPALEMKQPQAELMPVFSQASIEGEPNQDGSGWKVDVKKREAGDKQIRGGQSCSKDEKVLPCNANPETYFESAHCLRFSDLWYNVHKLVSPRMENSITVKIYVKRRTPEKKTCWDNLTKRMPGRIGTVNEEVMDETKKVIISYTSDDKVAFSLDSAGDYVLVPQPLSKRCKDDELKAVSRGGPQEYLVLKECEITFDGEECDKAGVTYAAFARQPHRCAKEASTCLRNQPLQFYREDKKAVEEGRQGQYFLSNFVTVPEQAILLNTSSNQVVLRVPYFKSYQSHVVVEVKADDIDIIGDRNLGQITEVYIDATSDKVTIVRAVITNMGVAPDAFGLDFANCSSPLGPSDFDKPGKDEIPPQHRITYTATISTPNLHKHTECTLALYNMDEELVASRHIVIERGQRCMCVWHCHCVCYNYPSPGLLCKPLSLRNYNRADFPGHLPVTINNDSRCILLKVLQGLLWFFIFLFLFGLVKGILGLCLSTVGVYGLHYIWPSEARSLYCYMEPCLAQYPVVRDRNGFPVHPRSFTHTVHFLPWHSEFLVNLCFFICALRSCLCHRIYGVFSNEQFDQNCYESKGRCNSPCRSPRPCVSPCGSPCSNRRRFRLHAGADEQQFDSDPTFLKDDKIAKRHVEELLRSYHVHRNLTRPLGGVVSVPGTPYCVSGFFLRSENGVFQFFPPSPLLQVRQMDGSLLDSPVPLDSAPFHATYNTAQDVLATRELSCQPRGVVINAL